MLNILLRLRGFSTLLCPYENQTLWKRDGIEYKYIEWKILFKVFHKNLMLCLSSFLKTIFFKGLKKRELIWFSVIPGVGFENCSKNKVFHENMF